MVVIELNGNYGRLQIFSIYNAGEHSDSLMILRQHMQGIQNGPQGEQDYHILWGGDFNQHHPMWDKDKDTHLFTKKALKDAGELINLVVDQEMCMVLPKGIPTLKHMVTKQLSRPDNIFCTAGLINHVVKCDVMPERQPGKTDHYPVVTILEITQERMTMQPSQNFRKTDWNSFNNFLGKELAVIPNLD